jgi:hypothetical protein
MKKNNIILKIFGILVGISSILAAYYAYQGLNFQKKQIIKESLPFFKYRFSEESNTFIVESDEDVSIHSIEWFLPYTDKTYKSFIKNSNTITINEIINVLWFSMVDRKILILSPEFQSNSYGFIKCEILSSFDEYQIADDKNPGFPIAVRITYTRKGESFKYFSDLLLIREFEDLTPQILSINANNVNENMLKVYLKNGTEKLDKILNQYSYSKDQNYLDEDGNCTRSEKFFKDYFYNKKDEEEFKSEMKKLLGE